MTHFKQLPRDPVWVLPVDLVNSIDLRRDRSQKELVKHGRLTYHLFVGGGPTSFNQIQKDVQTTRIGFNAVDTPHQELCSNLVEVLVLALLLKDRREPGQVAEEIRVEMIDRHQDV